MTRKDVKVLKEHTGQAQTDLMTDDDLKAIVKILMNDQSFLSL